MNPLIRAMATMFIFIKSGVGFLSTAVILVKIGGELCRLQLGPAVPVSDGFSPNWQHTRACLERKTGNANFASGTAAAGLGAGFGLNYIYLAQT